MHVSSLKIENYRKFGDSDNLIGLVDSNSSNAKDNIVASSTTLVIGKNNSGKTTVTKALELIISDSDRITGHDFNYNYINAVVNKHISQDFTVSPKMRFEIVINFDNSENDFTGALGAFINAKAAKENGIKVARVLIEYQVKEISSYNERVKQLFEGISSGEVNHAVLFRKYIDIISSLQFKKIVRNSAGKVIDKVSPKNIIDLRVISSAKNIHDRKLLTRSFNKIIKFMYENNKEDYNAILNLVEKNNDALTGDIKLKHQSGVESVLEQILSDKKIGIDLRSDLTFDKLMTDLVTYEHKDGDYMVPEGQFGLGYASLVSIIGEIIDYANQGLKSNKQSRIRLLCIEEPEVFMHPQMQVNFVRHIQEALLAIFELAQKSINSIKTQLLVTTHSSHILNSIIHGSNTFDEINYIYLKEGNAANLILKDNDICDGKSVEEKEHFEFIKKHIKHQVPELFFSDAIVLVEGITEERVLNYYIESDKLLSRMHISVFRIDGAHGKVYEKLLSRLKIPTLIITDVDYKYDTGEDLIGDESSDETISQEIGQITNIDNNWITTNATLKHFFNSNKIKEFNEFYSKDKLMVVYQKDGVTITDKGEEFTYFARSFEEAILLENFENEMLYDVLEGISKKVIREMVGMPKDYIKLAHNSSKIQKLLTSNKSDFSNSMIYSLVTKEINRPVLPVYINEGLKWLSNTLASREVDDVL